MITDKEYRKTPSHCPVCRSDQVSGGEVEINGNGAFQDVTCLRCEADWQDKYALQGYDINYEGNFKCAWKIVPRDDLRVALLPPGHGMKPIRDDYYCLEYSYNNFSERQKLLGVFDGFIGADLEMHVLVNTDNELVKNWKDSEGRP